MEKLQLTRRTLRAIAFYQPDPDLRFDDAFMMFLFGSANTVMIFERLLRWLPHGKRKDGGIYKSDADLSRETRLSTKTIERSRKILKEAGFEIRVMKANGAPTNHYYFNLEKFLGFVARKLHTTLKNVQDWFEAACERKARMHSNKVSKSPHPTRSQSSPQLSLLELDQLAESLTISNSNEETPQDKNTITTTDSEDDVDVVSNQSLKAEIKALHVQLGTSEADLQSWIEAYGLERVKTLAKRAADDPNIDSKGGWVRYALKNNYQWTDNPQRGKRKAKEEMTAEEYGKSYTSGSKYADFIHY